MSMGPRRSKKFSQRQARNELEKSNKKAPLPPCLIEILIAGPNGQRESTYPEDRWESARIAWVAELMDFKTSSDLSLSLILRMGQESVVLEEVLRK